MKIISIGTDRQLFIPDSEVGRRQIKRGAELGQLQIIVFALRRLGFKPVRLSPMVTVIPTNSRSRWFYLFDAIKIGKKFSRSDLITAQDPFECGLAAWRLAKYHRTKLELQIHTDFLSPYFGKGSLLNHCRVLLAGFLLPRADRIRVVSERIKQSLLAKNWKLKAEIEVRPIAVDVEKIKQSPVTIDLHQKYPNFSKIILMASRLMPEKNVGLALRAMREVVKKIPGAGLIIVGSGPLESELKLTADSYKLKASVIFEPWIDQSTLFSYYKTANLFLLTSLYEGYGLTLVEAQAAGCQLVSTDVGVAREMGARIVSPAPAEIARAIIESLT